MAHQALTPGVKVLKEHCVKSVRIRSFFGPYFPALGLNTNEGKYEPEKIQTWILFAHFILRRLFQINGQQ